MTDPSTSLAEDQNGHKIDPKGNLIHDERCTFCEKQPSVEEVLKKVKEINAYLSLWRHKEKYGTGEDQKDTFIAECSEHIPHIAQAFETLYHENKRMREALEKSGHSFNCRCITHDDRVDEDASCDCCIQEALSLVSQYPPLP